MAQANLGNVTIATAAQLSATQITVSSGSFGSINPATGTNGVSSTGFFKPIGIQATQTDSQFSNVLIVGTLSVQNTSVTAANIVSGTIPNLSCATIQSSSGTGIVCPTLAPTGITTTGQIVATTLVGSNINGTTACVSILKTPHIAPTVTGGIVTFTAGGLALDSATFTASGVAATTVSSNTIEAANLIPTTGTSTVSCGALAISQLIVGGTSGSILQKIVHASEPVNVGTVTAETSVTVTIAATGVSASGNNVVLVETPDSYNSSLLVTGNVINDNQIQVKIHNTDHSGQLNPATATINAAVFQF